MSKPPPRRPVVRGQVAQGPAARADEQGRGGTFFLSLLFLFPLAAPFYLWKSGLPQVADMLMVLVILSLGSRGLHFLKDDARRSAFRWLVLLTSHVIVVSLGWMMIYPTMDFVLPPLYYINNTLVFMLIFRGAAIYGDRVLRYFAWGTLMSVLVQAGMAPFMASGLNREVLFFNNPNQLGYYGLLCAAIIFLAYRAGHLPLWACLGGAASTLFLVALSQSKAAIIGIGVLGVLTSVGRARIVILFVGLLALVVPRDITVVTNVESRLSTVGEQEDDNWEGRGYGRIVDHPEYLVLGAAEGGYERLMLSPERQHEIHSSLGTLLFSYGIVGLLLFFAFLFAVSRCAGVASSLYLIPVMLYGLTHMGLREGLFWLLLGQMCCLNVPTRRNHAGSTARPVLAGAPRFQKPLRQAASAPDAARARPLRS